MTAKPIDLWNKIAEDFDSPWRISQNDAFDRWMSGKPAENSRLLLFFPTGEGKTRTSLALLKIRGFKSAVVLAPPITHGSWERTAAALDMTIRVMSVAKFRQKATKLPKDTPVIVDEVHELGKHDGIGFKKFDRMAQYFPAIILASATPNYNDMDRVYCIAKILDPLNNMGGYIPWVYKHCVTRVNPFASTPYVDGLLGYERASEWLLDAGYTAFAEDTASWNSLDIDFQTDWDTELFDLYNLDESQMRIMASQMEEGHRTRYLSRVDPATERLRPEIKAQLLWLLTDEPYLIYCMHERIAQAVNDSLSQERECHLVTGKTSTSDKGVLVRKFLASQEQTRIMIGTSAMATGLDGLDTVCSKLIIFDDIVGDDAKRRQLIGRVLPRSGQTRGTHVTTVHLPGD